MAKPIIGVLGLQGCVAHHERHVVAAGAEFKVAKTAADFDAVDGFILPGGESTTMLKLINVFGLEESLKRNFAAKPVWGICAGSILMASEVKSPAQKSFGLIDLTVVRNGYGRQLESCYEEVNGFEVAYIRAPVFERVGADVEVLAERDGLPTWVKQGKYMASAFHPELSFEVPSPMHKMFVEMVRK